MTELIDYVKAHRATHTYCGPVDAQGFRTHAGCEQWHQKHASQKYTGHFLYNNLHRDGIYFIDQNGAQVFFNGLFYANKLEGYGQVIYFDGSTFEGLFRNHERFGPGIVSHCDGTQDVGLWDGQNLCRLSIVVQSGLVPKLAKSPQGKAKLLKYRHLVTICHKTPDRARELLEHLQANEDVLKQSNDLYNLHARSPRSLLFNHKAYDESFFDVEDCTIEIALSQEEFTEESLSNTPDVSVENLGCPCFQKDKFAHFCRLLHDVEVKLEKLVGKRRRIEAKLNTCRKCCHYDNGVDEESQDYMFKDQSNNHQNSVPFSSNKSEIEIHSVIYSHVSTQPMKKQHSDDDDLSNITLPFNSTSSLSSDPEMLKFSQILKSPPLSPITSQVVPVEVVPKLKSVETSCICHDKNIKNVEVLEGKLHSIKCEENFYVAIKKSLQFQLDKEFDKTIRKPKYVKKVVVTDLLAWNNGKIWTKMLQHCFRHRRSESNVTFSIVDLLEGRRDAFKTPGAYETNCRLFLEQCGEGHDRAAFNLLRHYNINPDLCDADGNTGILLATATDKTSVIGMLVTCGCCVDAMNDEGLTPLNLALLKYITFRRRVGDWEKAFLGEAKVSNENLLDIRQWRPHESLLGCDYHVPMHHTQTRQKDYKHSVNEILQSTHMPKAEKLSEVRERLVTLQFNVHSLLNLNIFSDTLQEYLFENGFVRMPLAENKQKKAKKKVGKKAGKKADKKSSLKSKQVKKSKSPKKRQVKLPEVDLHKEELIQKHLETIKKTIMTLTYHRADPNVAQVPLKSLFLAVYTNDPSVVRALLENNADPNVTTEENLTCLHLIAAQEPSENMVEMCKILFKYQADPNVKTTLGHWAELKKEILGSGVNKIDESVGKNPLHLLCIRQDFAKDPENHLCELAKVLVLNGCRTGELYWGHTPLSLAIIRANVGMIDALLGTNRVDPHQCLGNDMGNALTLLNLPRFSHIYQLKTRKELLDVLLKHRANPLHPVGDCENAIEFIENELKIFDKGKKTKKSKVAKMLMETRDYIKTAARLTLLRYCQGKAVQYLYSFLTENLYADPLIEAIARFCTVDEALNCLRLAFQHKTIPMANFSYVVIMDLLHFVELHSELYVNKDKYEVNTDESFFQEVEETKWQLPEVDEDSDKYQVCFQCLKGRGKYLLRCPRCELVSFCSQACNELNMKDYHDHKCNILFYDKMRVILGEKKQPSRLSKLLEMCLKVNKERMVVFELKELLEKLSKLKVPMKEMKKKVLKLQEDAEVYAKEREQFGVEHKLLRHQKIVQNYEKGDAEDFDFRSYCVSSVNIKSGTEPNSFCIGGTSVASPSGSHAIISRVDEGQVNRSRKELKQQSSVRMSAIFDLTRSYTPTPGFVPKPRRRSNFFVKEKSKITNREFLQEQQSIDVVKNVSSNRDILSDEQIVAQGSNEKKPINRNYYMELLSKVFADFNLPLLLLPYACFKDGQVYYSMDDNAYFGKSFKKLYIPKS